MTLVEWVESHANRTAGYRELAGALGLTKAAVGHWCNGIRRVPAERCRHIEAATGGAVTCEELRPDVFGKPTRKKAA
jgi:DNA-binding transcriptional regulator YdaS (Cro superfamily)